MEPTPIILTIPTQGVKKHGYGCERANHDSKIEHKIDDRKEIRCKQGSQYL